MPTNLKNFTRDQKIRNALIRKLATANKVIKFTNEFPINLRI